MFTSIKVLSRPFTQRNCICFKTLQNKMAIRKAIIHTFYAFHGKVLFITIAVSNTRAFVKFASLKVFDLRFWVHFLMSKIEITNLIHIH